MRSRKKLARLDDIIAVLDMFKNQEKSSHLWVKIINQYLSPKYRISNTKELGAEFRYLKSIGYVHEKILRHIKCVRWTKTFYIWRGKRK